MLVAEQCNTSERKESVRVKEKDGDFPPSFTKLKLTWELGHDLFSGENGWLLCESHKKKGVAMQAQTKLYNLKEAAERVNQGRTGEEDEKVQEVKRKQKEKMIT